MPDHVPQPLGVDDDLRAGMQPDAGLGGGVVLVLAQDEDGPVRRVLQFEPGPDHPVGAVGVEPIVVVEV
jgi:hypothetical protein